MLLAKMGQKYVTYITYKNAKKDTRMAQCRHTGIYWGFILQLIVSRARTPAPAPEAQADRAS